MNSGEREKESSKSQSQLEGQTALVTGAARRIGREISLALAEEGVNVVVHYNRSATEAEAICRELIASGVKSWLIQADFRVSEETGSLIERALKISGSLDILINSASIFPSNTLDDLSLQDIAQNIEVNAWAPFVLSREFAKMVNRGKIINLIDSRTNDYDWSHVAYILSKHVFLLLTEMTAVRFAPHISVNGISPGLILPPQGKDQKYLDKLADKVPLKRHGSPTDIAEAVLYLLKSNFITGHVIQVDGGRHLVR